MRIPSTLRIGSVRWTVVQVAPNELGEDRPCGDTDRALARIRINKDLSPDVKAQTFFHELLHAIDGEMDHSHVELLATVLCQVMVDLPF